MPRISSPHDFASIFYRDYIPDPQYHGAEFTPSPVSNVSNGQNKPTLVFLHGWPMSSRMWEHLLVVLCQDHGFRCIAPDRRGFGQSEWNGPGTSGLENSRINFNTLADDVAFLLENQVVGDFVFVAASMGSGESLLAYERSPYVQKHCKGFIWIGPNLPYPINSPSNPTAPTLELWNSIRMSLRNRRADFVAESLPGVFGVPAGCVVSPKTAEFFERVVEQADSLALERCSQIMLHRDFTPEVRRLGEQGDGGLKLLLLHGDSDTGMPVEASSRVIKELVPRAVMNVYEKASHGLYLTHAEKVLADIVAFVGDCTTEERT